MSIEEILARAGLDRIEGGDTCLARYDATRKALVILHESRIYVFPVVPDSLTHLFDDIVRAAVK